jgi:hypothetical protein
VKAPEHAKLVSGQAEAPRAAPAGRKPSSTWVHPWQ